MKKCPQFYSENTDRCSLFHVNRDSRLSVEPVCENIMKRSCFVALDVTNWTYCNTNLNPFKPGIGHVSLPVISLCDYQHWIRLLPTTDALNRFTKKQQKSITTHALPNCGCWHCTKSWHTVCCANFTANLFIFCWIFCTEIWIYC